MIVVSPVVTGRRLGRPGGALVTRVAPIALCVLAACSGDARGTPARSTATAATNSAPTTAHASGDVVITPSSARYIATTDATHLSGSIAGIARFKAPVSALPAVPTGNDSALCGVTVPDESVREKSGELEGVVVWLDGVRAGKPMPLDRRIELESDHCRLVPRVQAAPVASAVNVISHDDMRQHLRFMSTGDDKLRTSVLIGGGEQVIPTNLPFASPGMLRITDGDHAWPVAFIAVFDQPYYTVTSPGGAFTIDGIPPGTYTLHAWHERAKPFTQTVQVGANAAARVDVVLDGR